MPGKNLLLIFSFLFFLAQSQSEDYVNDNVLKYDDFIYKPNIRTVIFHQSGWDFSAPLIKLNSDDQLELSFDDTDGDQKQYSVSFVYCNADWTPSNLMTTEYLSNFFEMNILNYSYAMATNQKYTHYTLVFPQNSNQMNIKIYL